MRGEAHGLRDANNRLSSDNAALSGRVQELEALVAATGDGGKGDKERLEAQVADLRQQLANALTERDGLSRRLSMAEGYGERIKVELAELVPKWQALQDDNARMEGQFKGLVGVFFKEIDTDRSGHVGKEELRATRVRLGLPVSDAIT